MAKPGLAQSRRLGDRVVTRAFISCDWGTSVLRLRYVDAGEGLVLTETSSDDGMKRTYAGWRRRGGDRVAACYQVLERQVARIEPAGGFPEPDLPLVVSGMASSSIGLLELPYGGLPFPLDGAALPHRVLDRRLRGGQPVVLLSGLRTDADVMRGEETQMVGLRAGLGLEAMDGIFVLPGTHSKHIVVETGRITGFRTYMTGELFDVLARHSVLGESIAGAGRDHEPAQALDGAPHGFRDAGVPDGLDAGVVEGNADAFDDGVLDGSREALPHALFRVRAGALLGDRDPPGSFWYLSGLLIGAELGSLRHPTRPIHLAAGARLARLYRRAFEALRFEDRVRVLPPQLVDHSTARGQLELLRAMGGLRTEPTPTPWPHS